jgi:hypothetical protein
MSPFPTQTLSIRLALPRLAVTKATLSDKAAECLRGEWLPASRHNALAGQAGGHRAEAEALSTHLVDAAQDRLLRGNWEKPGSL